jgi:phosphate-selective porin OprO/OprP
VAGLTLARANPADDFPSPSPQIQPWETETVAEGLLGSTRRPLQSLIASATPRADDDAEESGPEESGPEESGPEESDEASDLTASELLARLEALSKDHEELKQQWDTFQEKESEKKKESEQKPVMKIGGRVHIDSWNFSESDPGINVIERGDPNLDPEDRWTFRRLRLEMAGTVPQNMLWRMQFDFNNPSEPEIKDAYLGWSDLPNNQTLLLGNQKRPLGLDHWNSSRFNVFAERPLAVEAFNEDTRRFGLTMYGNNDDDSLGWAYGIYNLENINTTGRFIGDALQMGSYNRLWASPWYDETSGGRGYLHLAIAGAVAKPDGDGAFDGDSNTNEARFRTRPMARSDERWLDTGRIPGAEWFEILGLETILNVGAFQVCGEYFFTGLQREDVTPPGGLGAPYQPPLDNDLFFHGGYVYVSYFLTGEFNPYDRESGALDRVIPFENFFLVDRCGGGKGHGWGALQLALRYDHLDLTDGGVQGGVSDALTAGLNWHWTPYSKVQVNTILGTIEQSGNAGPFDGGDFLITGARYMIDF